MASFRKRGDKWEYRIIYKDSFDQRKKEKTKGGFTTKKEAQLAARKMEMQLDEGLFESSISLQVYLNEWLYEHKKDVVRRNTFDLHQTNVKNHINPYFNNLKLKDLTPSKYQKFLNKLYEAGYSRRTIEIVHGTMYNAISKAVTQRKLPYNPCEGATIKGTSKKSEIKFIDSSQIPSLLKEAYQYGYIYWLFFLVLIETGLRKGEAAAIQWTDIDFKEQTINITKTLDFKEKTKDKLFGDTKNYNSKRLIKISQSLTRVLQEHAKHQNQNKLALGDLYHHDLNLVLCRQDGNYMPKSSLFNAFKKILVRIDHPQLPIHSLRHTHVVLQMEAGADLKYIQERLGHGGIEITADVYAHLSKKLEEQQMNRFEEYTKDIFTQNTHEKKMGK